MKHTVVLLAVLLLAPLTVLCGRAKAEADAAAGGAPASAPASLPVDLSASHDFAAPQNITADAAAALAGLCTLAEFRALPAADRYVCDFETWPAAKDSLGVTACDFRFHLAAAGVTDQKVAFTTSGAFPPTHILGRSKAGETAASPAHVLVGLGNIGWGAMQGHTFTFERPVRAFGLVYRSPENFKLQNFHWPNATQNGCPVSYTLTDGTIVNLGQKGQPSEMLKADANTFVGVIDKSGRGIVAVRIHVKGTGKGDQRITLDDLAFVTMPQPAAAPVANLRSSHDFTKVEGIAAAPAHAPEGLASLADFRFIVGTHRFVYDFTTWPKPGADLGSNSFEFQFDVKGRGAVGQKVKVTATDAGKTAKLAKTVLSNDDGSSTTVLSGLGDIGKAAGGWAQQTFKFDKPVWSFGVVYRSPNEFALGVPVSYTLVDGSVKTVDKKTPAAVVAGNSRTFVGVSDSSGKGITSVTFRVQGTAAAKQPVYIESLAFALAGLPPGEWKLTWSDEFDGKALDTTKWSTGYRFVEVINNELQAYVPENVVVANGICTIKVEKRECKNTDWKGNTKQKQAFASGAIITYDKFAQKYGYFEARVKMTSGPGTWPAFWLLPDRGREVAKLDDRVGTGDRGYGFGSEIDVFEFMPWWKTAEGLFLCHSGCIWSYGKVTEKDPAPHAHGGYALDNNGYGPAMLKYPHADTQFHTYGLYWGPGRLTFYIDSKPVFYVDDAKHVPNVPEYILLNCALSRNGWGMGPGKKDPTMKDIEEGMPSAMEIDYVRVYSGTPEP